MNFSIKDYFGKCEWIWSHLLQKSLMGNFVFCAVILQMTESVGGFKHSNAGKQ